MAETAPQRSTAAPRAGVNTTGEMRQLGAGRKLGRYTLLRRIAAGGMAEVYAARSHGVSGFEKKVAIKKILPQFSLNARFVDMLVDEAKIAVSLTHPNIAQIYELGLEDETYYIVMEFVDGRPLNRLLQKVDARGHRTIPIEHAVHIVAEVSKGLYHAHEQRDHRGQALGIVHRDVSPQNVMIAHTGDVKLIDFGIARAEGRAAQTNVGTIKGKLRYLAPEIALGLEPDHRVDVYCCGIVLFELLTGEAMFAPRTDVEAIEMASQAKVRSPRLSNPQVPVELEEIVMRALVRDRDHRYPSAKALYVDLRRFLNTYAPAFVGSELGDYMQAIFGAEIEEDRRLDRLAERVLVENEEPAPPAGPRSTPPEARGADARSADARSDPKADVVKATAATTGEATADESGAIATHTKSGGYRELVTRSSIELVQPVRDDTADRPEEGAEDTKAPTSDTAAIAAATRPLVDMGAIAGGPTRATIIDASTTSPSTVVPARAEPKSDLRAPARRPPYALVIAALAGAAALTWALARPSSTVIPANGAPAVTAASDAPIPIAPIAPLPSPPPGTPALDGRLMVEVAPTVAIDVSVDGRLYIEQALPPVRVEVPVREEPQTITIAARGYRSTTLTKKLSRNNEILVTVSLDPVRTTVTLVGLDAAAKVSTDHGRVVGSIIEDVEFGSTVAVRVQRPGARDFSVKVDVDDPAGVALEIPRGQAVARGTLRVASRPFSDVFVNDRLVGRTPYEASMPVGTYRVALKRSGAVHKVTMTVSAGKVADVAHQW